MKRILIIFLAVFFLFSFSQTGYAQHKRKKKKKSHKTEKVEWSNITSKLWYGGGFNLGFSGSSRYNYFAFGLSPMVGYKITKHLSAGPRVSLQYNYVKGHTTDGNIHSKGLVSYAAGIFSRFKIVDAIFLHAEYEYENAEFFYTGLGGDLVYDNENDRILTDRQSRNNYYLGAGYSSGSIWRYEFLILYNLAKPEIETTELPFTFRVGFTYNF